MKLLVAILCLFLSALADTPDKLWTTPVANMIESVETIVSASDDALPTRVERTLSDAPLDEPLLVDRNDNVNLDDLPLAKIYPQSVPSVNEVDEVTVAQRDEVEVPPKKRMPKESAKVTEEIQKAVKSETEKEHISSSSVDTFGGTTELHDKPAKVKNEVVPSILKDTAIDFDRLRHLLQTHPLLTATLILSLLSLLFLLWMVMRRKGSNRRLASRQSPGEKASEVTLSSLEEYSRLKGEVRLQFLHRKQNILFNDDFTQYQKAKALLELEKEYAQIEFFDLPKLFSDDFNRFSQGHQALASKPELREIVAEFVGSRLGKNDYTKRQREHIQQNMRGVYRSPHHTWEYEEKMEHPDDAEQNAYLLQ